MPHLRYHLFFFYYYSTTTTTTTTYHEIEVPGMKTADISITTGSKSTEDVKCLRGLVVGIKHTPWVVPPGFLIRGFTVNDITTVGRELLTIHQLERL